MSWLRDQCSLLGEFLRSDFRRSVFWCAVGLTAAFALGLGGAALRPELAETAIDAFTKQVAQAGVLDEEGGMFVFGLLMNNWRAMLLSAAYGFIPFLFLPVISLLVNGALLGIMASYYMTHGMSMLLFLAGILPHGVLELPALVLSIACGACLCRNMCRIVTGSRRAEPLAELLGDLLRVMLLLVLPMIAAAAVLEAYVTPVVMSFFLR